MIPIDSQALEEARRILGLGGSGSGAAAGVTEYDDGLLQQVFDTVPVIRRGRTIAGSEGIFAAAFANVHVGGTETSIDTTTEPFNEAAAAAGFPSPIPRGLDLWLLKSFFTISTAGVFNDGMLRVTYPAAIAGFGLLAVDLPYAIYNAEVSAVGVIWGGSSLQGTDLVVQGRPLRLHRQNRLELSTRAQSAVTVTCNLLLGLFPASLGQDIVG